MEGHWAKHAGLKRGDIENTLGEHIGNLAGTHWVLIYSKAGSFVKF